MPKPDVGACEGISDGGLREESGKRWIPITGCLIMLKVERNTRRLQESWPSTAVSKNMTSSGRIL